MLTNWRIRNFKSFADQPDLRLSAINVLAGANSSGKSSIIQSILLLKQTIQYGSENRPIALNGPLLRLGAFNDVLNYEKENESIEIGFTINLSHQDVSNSQAGSWVRNIGRYRYNADKVCSEEVGAFGRPKQDERGRDSALAYRVHLTGGKLGLRLMYWEKSGEIEFANIGVKHELLISYGRSYPSSIENIAFLFE